MEIAAVLKLFEDLSLPKVLAKYLVYKSTLQKTNNKNKMSKKFVKR